MTFHLAGSSSCPSQRYVRCARGNQGVAFHDICDGKRDCPDGEDESRLFCDVNFFFLTIYTE